MNYLTTQDIAKRWGITSRMVAYYCKEGKIPGAIKKGKTWLIPIDASPPTDGRVKINIVNIKEDASLQKDFIDINKYENDNESITYHSSTMQRNMGFTRAALRYYEDLELINPNRKEDSSYRAFDMKDISQLLAIDFFRKRGFTPLEIKDISSKNSTEELTNIIQKKMTEINDNITRQKYILNKLQETKLFYDEIQEDRDNYTIKYFSIHEVKNVFPTVSDFSDYQNQVIKYIDFENEDILSNMVRTITFDENGYNGTQMCIVEEVDITTRDDKKSYLEHGKCLHRIIHADSDDNSVMEDMFVSATQWAKEHDLIFKGYAYIFIRLATLQERGTHHFYEVWIPIK
ncbi:MAG: MerR family transcriptional regulator [Coprobacillaceae bacterium]